MFFLRFKNFSSISFFLGLQKFSKFFGDLNSGDYQSQGGIESLKSCRVKLENRNNLKQKVAL